jgi:hypothetical protein
MPQTSLLDGPQWSAFRLFLVDLADDDLIRVDRQLRHEVATCQEFEQNITRLFFSSLSPSAPSEGLGSWKLVPTEDPERTPPGKPAARCRPREPLRVSAMEAKIADHVWDLAELLA